MANRNTRSFRYKASRDIIITLIGTIIAIVLFSVIKEKLGSYVDTYAEFSTLDSVMAFIIIDLPILACIGIIADSWISIYRNTYRRLIIDEDEVTYSYGWLTKKTVTIPAHKIRSCKKISGPLQRVCGSMDIIITTAGDESEIYFANIENGELAYRQITQLSKVYGRETS